MTVGNEDEVKKALGIQSFRELSKDKVLALVASMPDMANEVRLKLIEQIPAVKKFALESISSIERTFSRTLDSDDKDSELFHESLTDVRRVIDGQLDRNDISEEHQRFLIDHVVETLKEEAKKNTENKQHRAEQAKQTRDTILMVLGLAVLTAILFAGGKVAISPGATKS